MHVLKLLLSWRALLAAAALAALSACVVEDGPRPRPIPDDGPRFCTREYAPVCGRDGRDSRTFGNACEARAAGYRIVREGECRREQPEPEEQQFCTRQYDPVCARRGGDMRTFGNSCEADAAGYRVVRAGECRREPDNDQSACESIRGPVCGRRGDHVRPFANACAAEDASYSLLPRDACMRD